MKKDNQMNLESKVFLMASILAVLSIGVIPTEISAQTNEVTVTPINEEISLEKTVTTMTIPKDNTFPWGFVKGAPSEYVERFPVIIQFYSGEDPVHFAQVDVKGDGSYEYKFRVRNLDSTTGEFVNIFEGDYTVKIFKVIPNSNDIV